MNPRPVVSVSFTGNTRLRPGAISFGLFAVQVAISASICRPVPAIVAPFGLPFAGSGLGLAYGCRCALQIIVLCAKAACRGLASALVSGLRGGRTLWCTLSRSKHNEDEHKEGD